MKMTKIRDFVIETLSKLPTTETRIVVTLLVVLATAAKYLLSNDWVPAVEWLSFLVIYAGLDVTQWVQLKKAKTNDKGEDNDT